MSSKPARKDPEPLANPGPIGMAYNWMVEAIKFIDLARRYPVYVLVVLIFGVLWYFGSDIRKSLFGLDGPIVSDTSHNSISLTDNPPLKLEPDIAKYTTHNAGASVDSQDWVEIKKRVREADPEVLTRGLASRCTGITPNFESLGRIKTLGYLRGGGNVDIAWHPTDPRCKLSLYDAVKACLNPDLAELYLKGMRKHGYSPSSRTELIQDCQDQLVELVVPKLMGQMMQNWERIHI